MHHVDREWPTSDAQVEFQAVAFEDPVIRPDPLPEPRMIEAEIVIGECCMAGDVAQLDRLTGGRALGLLRPGDALGAVGADRVIGNRAS